MSEWQPIESLPTDGTPFLVATAYKPSPVHEAYFDRTWSRVFFADGTQCRDAVAWMPLPAPPESTP